MSTLFITSGIENVILRTTIPFHPPPPLNTHKKEEDASFPHTFIPFAQPCIRLSRLPPQRVIRLISVHTVRCQRCRLPPDPTVPPRTPLAARPTIKKNIAPPLPVGREHMHLHFRTSGRNRKRSELTPAEGTRKRRKRGEPRPTETLHFDWFRGRQYSVSPYTLNHRGRHEPSQSMRCRVSVTWSTGGLQGTQ